jgi:hypothetical protein
MQNAEAYRLEQRTLKALNGRLHAEIWRSRNFEVRKEIEANERRIRTIDYLILQSTAAHCSGCSTAAAVQHTETKTI